MFNNDHVHEKKAKKKKACAWQLTRPAGVHPVCRLLGDRGCRPWGGNVGSAGGRGWEPRLHCIALHLRFLRKERGRLRGGSRPFRIKHRFAVISFSRALDCHTHWLKNEASAFTGDVQAVLHSCHWNSLVPQRVRRDLNQKLSPPLKCVLVCKTPWQQTQTSWVSMTMEVETRHQYQNVNPRLAKAHFTSTWSTWHKQTTLIQSK